MKRAVDAYPSVLEFVPDHFKTQEICEEAVDAYPQISKFAPDYLKTKKMFDKTVSKDICALKFVLE